MASTNGITGDSLVNKPNSKEYEENYDKIFGKKDKTQDPVTKPFPHNILRPFECSTACGHYECMEHQDQCKRLEKSSSRIDIIGQNENDGDHYEYELNKSTGEVEKRFKDGFEKPNGDQFGD